MARKIFFRISVSGTLLILLLSLLHPAALWGFAILLPYILVGLYDINTPKHNVLHNYPVIGHLRYLLQSIGPELRQYFIETNQSGRPYNREIRNLIYARAKKSNDTQPFGTQFDITSNGYHRANHSLSPKTISQADSRVKVGGTHCKQPYEASRLNISAMSFGALSPNAIRALNAGAKLGGFAHNTGEGGLSPYHQQEGGDIFWQIGTGYFGCRNKHGNFDPDAFADKAALPQVKMIEIKLSQGAKPAHGGVLPAKKVNQEIADIRLVPVGEDVISPPAHTAFSTPTELLIFVEKLRSLSGGKPVGFKLCIGNRTEFMGICKAMLDTGIVPDFITVDGAEGGTGAAPVEYTDRLGTPLNEGLLFVHNCLVGTGLRNQVRIIASGKVATGFDIITKLALGADMCNAARAMMFALGCIQSLRCNTNTCPTGIATQDPKLGKAVNIREKHVRVANYHGATVESMLEILGAMGLSHPDQLQPEQIWRRVEDEREKNYRDLYNYLAPEALLGDDIPPDYATDWHRASAQYFASPP
ncbi:FMN-binding glutamate synthase family protein [Aliamphritea hakodatensis]|uniref:FMN-binding glutamate synthase family protein n=1 Tax=Aliamphritea hakodatensis TaxID=2895352 RepID=UPI0022FDA9C4|nr:FMN-binding glutamate synthase family protein [Aliamphritea hakodatensis]